MTDEDLKFYYVWGYMWDQYEVKTEYTYRSKGHSDYVVLNDEQAFIFRLAYSELPIYPYPEYKYYQRHLYEV